MIVRGGMNVYADDVEAALHAHPDVVEAAVVGVPHEVLGEDVAAYVVLRPGSGATTEELIDFAGQTAGRLQGAPPGGGGGRAAEERRRQGGQGRSWPSAAGRWTGGAGR